VRQLKTALGFSLVIGAIAAYFFNHRQVPSGFYTDAAANVLNALCIAKTGADEYGNFWPVAIRAFDDWRPPLLVYLFSVVSLFHPVDLYAARLISMVLGLLGCCFMVAYLRLSSELPRARYSVVYSAFFAFALTSSWVMVVHRMPVEFVLVLVTVAPMFVLSWRLIKQPTHWKLGIVVGISIGMLPYAYYGTKPLFVTQLALLACFSFERTNWRTLLKEKKGVLVAAGIALLFALPAVLDLLGAQNTAARFHSVGNMRVPQWFVVFFKHQDLRLFFFTGDANLRHHTRFLGVLNLVFLPFYLVGLYQAFRRAVSKRVRYWQYVLAFYFIAFLPVSLTNEGIPHSLRTLCCLPALLTICFLGYCEIELWLWERASRMQTRAALASWLVVGIALAFANIRTFQIEVPKYDRTWWTFVPPLQIPKNPAPYRDHRAETVDERLERVLQGDYAYCGAFGVTSVNPRSEALSDIKAVLSSATPKPEVAGVSRDNAKHSAIAEVRVSASCEYVQPPEHGVREPAAPPNKTARLLPTKLQVGDRLADETGDYEVIGRPYTTAGGKSAHIRVQKSGEPSVTETRTWGTHEHVTVTRRTGGSQR
jgi:hypothetical protein